MAVLKKIKFGTGAATPIAQTVVTAASESVLSVVGTNTGIDDNADPSYAVDLNISADGTLVKDTTGSQAVLKVGTVPAAQVSVADSGDKFTATNVEAALAELKDGIDKVVSDGKTYSIIDDTVNVQDLPTNVLKRYRLQQTVGSTNTLVGDPIDILKDNSLLAAKLSTVDATWNGSAIVDGTGAEALVLVYKDANGTAQVIAIDVSAFLKEAEFGDGLQVTNGVVSAKLGQGLEFGGESGENQSIKVKIDSTSSGAENFLSVGANGVKISGVQEAIDTSIAALDFTTDAAVAGQYVAAIEETDGVVAVKTRANVSEAVLNNYAKGSAPAAGSEAVAATDTVNQAIAKLEHQVDAAEAAATSGITTAIQALDFTDTAVAGQYVSKVDETDGVVSVTRANVSDAVLTGYTKGNAPAAGSEAVAATDDVKGAIAKLEHQVDAAKSAASAAHSVVAKGSDNTHVTVTASQPDASTGAVTYTIGETNIADADDLSDEISRAQTAEGEIAGKVGLTGAEGSRTFTPTTNYGGTGASASTSVMDNMQKLDTQIKTNADAIAALETQVDGISYYIDGTNLILSGIPYVAPQQNNP